MQTPSFTPGPWGVHGGSDYPNPRVNGPNGRAVANAVQRDDWHKGDGISMAEALANAALIAAAPCLLADLKEAASTLRRYEVLHRAKGTADSDAKAEVNAALASRFEATIARALPQVGEKQ